MSLEEFVRVKPEELGKNVDSDRPCSRMRSRAIREDLSSDDAGIVDSRPI